LRRRGAAPEEIGLATELALGKVFARPQLVQLRPHVLVVEARQHVALGDHLALAIADLDDAIADDGRHSRPADRLDRARRVDDLDRGATHRRDSRDHRHRAHEPPPCSGRGD